MNSPAADEIKAARAALGITQAEAAALVHVDRRSWQKWEGAERSMHPAFWELFGLKTKRIARMLGISRKN